MWHAWGRGEVDTGFGGETRGKGTLGRHMSSWGDNIKIPLQEIGGGGLD